MKVIPGRQIKNTRAEARAFLVRAWTLFGIAVGISTILVGRLFQLQVLEYEFYETRSEHNRIEVQPVAAGRGLIFDRHGVLLAENRSVSSLEIVKERTTNVVETINAVRGLIEIQESEIEAFHRRLARKRRPYQSVALKLRLREEEAAVIRVNGHLLPGVRVSSIAARHYPLGEVVSHAVGSVRRITVDDLKRLDRSQYAATRYVGRRGIEAFYEPVLHGDVGYRRVEVDVRGRVIRQLELSPPVKGGDLKLHLDSRLQILAYNALGDRRGAVVAIEPGSGGILAMVSRPSYDPNLFVSGMTVQEYRSLNSSRDLPLFNRAAQGQYAPGSTFKPIVGLAAVSKGVTSWDETIVDQGWFKLPGQRRIFRDWSWTPEDAGGQGIVDLRRAIYRSSNVYFYDLATRLKIDALSGFASQFGLGSDTALDVYEAVDGILPSREWKYGVRGEDWYTGDTVNMGIGQGYLLVTPLQLATVASVFATRGQWKHPRMLFSRDDPSLNSTQSPPPPISGPSQKDWELMIGAMEEVVHRGDRGIGGNGTAWSYIGRDIAYRMAGKSGTAQVVGINQDAQYDEAELNEYERKHAWFIAFAPSDEPVIAIAVLVENGGGGSSVAAPIVREILDAYLRPKIASNR